MYCLLRDTKVRKIILFTKYDVKITSDGILQRSGCNIGNEIIFTSIHFKKARFYHSVVRVNILIKISLSLCRYFILVLKANNINKHESPEIPSNMGIYERIYL